MRKPHQMFSYNRGVAIPIIGCILLVAVITLLVQVGMLTGEIEKNRRQACVRASLNGEIVPPTCKEFGITTNSSGQ